MKDTLRLYVGRYIRRRKKMVSCQQQHFRQLCLTCREFTDCKIYAEYALAWFELQRAYKRCKPAN